MSRFWLGIILLTCVIKVSAQSNFAYAPTSFSFAYGHGLPNGTSGTRATLRWNSANDPLCATPLKLSGYWDLSIAEWWNRGNYLGHHWLLSAIGFNPMFRIAPRRLLQPFIPYLEIGVGPTLFSTTQFGRRDLGSRFAFQDIMGGGIVFGPKSQWDFSYHYLHYSNAGLAALNEGIDIKILLTLAYRWN